MNKWIANKNTDKNKIFSLLQDSISTNHVTNYGPLVQKLENKLKVILNINNDYSIIVTNNATSSIHALVDGIRLYLNKDLILTTQDFTFPSSLQGPLKNSFVVDVTDNMEFDLSKVDNSSDGLIITNLFGHCCNIQTYLDYCSDNNKILVFDNATGPLTYYKNQNISNYGDGSIISLHHTKPLGFGEGGIIVCKKIYENSIRSIINFGYSDVGIRKWNILGNNYKMSDISAAFILLYLEENCSNIYKHHIDIYDYFLHKSKLINLKIFPNFSDKTPFVSCIPFFIENSANLILELNQLGIEAKKYYPPLTGLPVSTYKYDNIVCLPCNIDTTTECIDICFNIINKYL